MLVRLPHSSLGLRARITVGLGLVAVLAVLSSVFLAVLTSHLRAADDEVAASLRSVSLVERAEIELLLHARAADPIVRSAHETSLRQRLADAQGHLTTPEARDAFSSAAAAVDAYLGGTSEDARPADPGVELLRTFAALESLTNVNERQFRSARERAARADRLGTRIGVAVVLVVVPLAAALTWWLWRRALAPLFDLGRAMEHFAAGERGWRAPIAGPVELREMARRFNDMAHELTRQREARAAFLAGIAHDLRNPLMPLRMAATILRERIGSAEAGTLDLMRTVDRQVDHLERMIGDLLETSRVHAGALALRLEDVDTRALATEAVESFRAAAPGHAFQLSAPEEPVRARCDPQRLLQVLNNLVSNAVKYSPAGSRVTIAVGSKGTYALLTVADEGIGVAPQELPALFEPFRRTRSAAASAIPGIGLGLFVARRIVEAHGGRLDLESRLGIGSTFTVRVPLSPPSPSPTAHQQGAAAPEAPLQRT